MSAPGNEFREAEYLGLGFLAVTSSELLDQLLAGKSIDEDDKHTLRRAIDFLKKASSGARLVNSGVSSNANALETVSKFAYSVEPLRFVQDKTGSADIEAVFKKMATSIEVAMHNPASASIDRTSLTTAKNFFSKLHVLFTDLVEASKRRTGIDTIFGSALSGLKYV
ncbi:MAG: hypothetical protein RKO25_01850 [Candidatus Contendobacter sp.]|nr:hypothetical protein [Candidatus Contendobacter sp.]